MKVLVTGGTGFVGGHVVAALAKGGHDIRLLVRRPEQVQATLGPLTPAEPEVVVGDVLDEQSVAAAISGCDALVHAAAVYSFDPRRAEEMRRTNVRATEIALGAAIEGALDPVVHISSTVALTRRGGSDPGLPLGDIDLPYTQSKIDAERVARKLQDGGAPVVTIYPGAVYGPHDPYRGEQTERLRWLLRGQFPIWPRGGLHIVDVRDVATLVAAVLEPGRGPRRFVVPGHHVDGHELYRTLAGITGRRLPHVIAPRAVLAPTARFFDAVQRPLPERWRYPANLEGAEVTLRDTRFDDTPAREEFGLTPRSLAETLTDTIRWLADTGRLPRRYAGDLAR